MGTKRKAEDEILEIPSDDDDGSDSDVQIQEKPIPIVTVDDDDDSSTTAPSHSTPVRQPSPACGGKALDSSLGTPPPPPDISSNRSMSEEKQTMTEEKMASENLLLSMKFRDQELFHMFKGSLSEYLRTTFQLKMGGEEVDVVQQVDQFSIQVLSKSLGRITTAAILPAAENSEPVQNSNEVLLPGKECSNVKHSDAVDDAGMFVIDSTPAKTAKGGPIIPSYKKALHKVLDNSPSAAASADSATKRPKPKQNCWNCDGDHSLKDCKQPRNFVKIDKMKQAFMKTKDRYHVDLEQKYGHIVPGRMTHELRQALGLRKRDLPVHIYRMRLFGYPPGWLEDAKITHSGLQLFNSNGDPVLESDESDGEVDNVKTIKYDVRKIISFPGFNVDSGEAYIDNSKFYGVPPRMGHQSRDEMIRNLEGTLVQGYRTKKLRLDSVAQVDIDRDPADMDLDNPDESFIKVNSVGDCDKLEGLVTASQCSSLPSYNGNIVGAPAMDADEPEEGEVDETEEPQNGSNQNEDEAEDGKNERTNDDSLILVEEEAEVICLDPAAAVVMNTRRCKRRMSTPPKMDTKHKKVHDKDQGEGPSRNPVRSPTPKRKRTKPVRDEDPGEGPSRNPVRSPTPKRKWSKSVRDEDPGERPSRSSMFRTPTPLFRSPLLNRPTPTGTEPEPTFNNYHLLSRRQRERVLYDEVVRQREELNQLKAVVQTWVTDVASVRLDVHALTEQQTKLSQKMSIFVEPPRPTNERRVFPSSTFAQHVELVKAKNELGQLREMLPENVLMDVYEEFLRSAKPTDGPMMIRACILTYLRYKPFSWTRFFIHQKNAVYAMLAHFESAVGFQVPVKDWEYLDKRIVKQCSVLNAMERVPLPLFQTPLTEQPADQPEPELDSIKQVLSEQVGLIIERLKSESTEQLEPAEAVDHPELLASTEQLEP